jgi:hypothetical protein
VLNRFADQSGTEIVYNGNMTDGLLSSGLSGRFSTAEALSRILAGTGLTFRPNGANSFTLDHMRPRVAEGTAELGSRLWKAHCPVRQRRGLAVRRCGHGGHPFLRHAGRRQTWPYARNPARDPQSITVMTRQRIEDQNLLALDQVLERDPVHDEADPRLWRQQLESRGINLGLANYMIDSVPGTIVSPVGWAAADTAIYDRVEVQRGGGPAGGRG